MEKYFFVDNSVNSGTKINCKTGSVLKEYNVISLSSGETVSITLNNLSNDTILCVNEVHTRLGGVFAYSIHLTDEDGEEIYFRDYEQSANAANGYFIRLPHYDNKITLCFVGEYGEALLESVTVLRESELSHDKMTVSFFTPKLHSDIQKTVSEVSEFCKNIERTERFKTAISFEMLYMNRSDRQITEQLKKWITVAKKCNVSLIVNLNSWWSGTPAFSDGLGGRFTDFEYQQVTYDRRKKEYDFSVPNMWANMPWLTMNNTHLNNARNERLHNVYALVMKIAKDASFKNIDVFLDNEPAYWALFAYGGDADSGGDFSSWVREDALKDGVVFKDYEPLNNNNRRWLLDNMNRYITELAKSCDDNKVYTHVFPFAGYPYMDTKHSQWETHITPYSRLGVESSTWEDERIYDYAVRFGRFGNINAERACIHNFDFIKQNYIYGLNISQIFNFVDTDASDVLKKEKELDGMKVQPCDYPIPVLRLDAFNNTLDFDFITEKENIGIYDYRNRRGIRPNNEGKGKFTIDLGETEKYGKKLVIELWAFCDKNNGGITLTVSNNKGTEEIIEMPEYCNEGKPYYISISLDSYNKNDCLNISFEIENNDFGSDWCKQNYIWDLRVLKPHRTVAGHTNGYLFSADEMRALNRIFGEKDDCLIKKFKYNKIDNSNIEVGGFLGMNDGFLQIMRTKPQDYLWEPIADLVLDDNSNIYLKDDEKGNYHIASVYEIPKYAFGKIDCKDGHIINAYFESYEFKGRITKIQNRKAFPKAESGKIFIESKNKTMAFSVGRECSIELENAPYKCAYAYKSEDEIFKVGNKITVRYTKEEKIDMPYRALSVK